MTSVALWDTTGADVLAALVAQRRVSGAVASGQALTLVVVSPEREVAQAEAAATRAAAMHPCRLLVVVRDPSRGERRLDAEVAVGDRFGPVEAVVLRMRGELAEHAESLVLPLLAPDVPVVCAWLGPPPPHLADDPLAGLADRRVTDAARAADPVAALRAQAAAYRPGDTDLAWTRATPWRALLASGWDALGGPPTAATATVTAAADDPTALLLAGWLRARLGVVPVVTGGAGGVDAVSLAGDAGQVGVRCDDGMALVTLPGQPERALPLPHPELGDLLAEEIRRLDPDEVYADALAAASG